MRKDLMIATLPNRERPLNFHKLINIWHSSSLSRKFCFRTCSSSQEKLIPRVLMPVHHSRPRGVSKEFLFFTIHIALVFEKFIFKLEHFSKLSRVCITFSTDEILASVAVMLSAYNKDLVSSSPILCLQSIHCEIKEVMGSNPVQVWIFFRL